MATDDTTASTAATGRLLGTNKLQSAADALATTVGKLTAVLSSATSGLGRAADQAGRQSGGSGNGGAWNVGSNWSGGRNGGGATMGGQPVGSGPPRGPYDTHVIGGTPQAPGSGNGASRAGAAFGGAVVGGSTALLASAASHFSDNITMQTAAALATQSSTMPWRAASRQAFFNNYGAQSSADAASAYLTTARTTGYAPGSAQFANQWQYAKGASLVNPNISQTQAAQASASLWQGASYNSLRAYGINTIVGGAGQTPRQIAQQIIQKIPGASSIKTPEQLTAALDSPGGGINQTLNAWAAQGMLANNSQDVIREEIRGILLAQVKGVGYNQYSTLMSQAANGDKSAKNSLSKLHIGNTLTQTLMTRAGTLQNRQQTELGGFASGVEHATAVLDKFSNALTGILSATGGSTALGFLGGGGTLTKSAAGGSGFMGFLGSIGHAALPGLGMVSGAAGGATGGGSGGGSGGSSAVAATGTQGAGKTGAAAINIAKRYLGMPYKWGGNNPKSSFDCSGLMQYVFKQIGVTLPRTSQQQQKVGKAVSLNALQPGDLVFVGNPAHHEAMYIGGGKIIEAPHTGGTVQIRGFNPGEWTGGARRILGSAGNVGAIGPNSQGQTAGSQNGSFGAYGGDVGSYGSEADALAALIGGSSGSVLGNLLGNIGGVPGGASGSTSSNPTAGMSSVPGGNGASSNIALGQKMAAQRGWTGSKWNSLRAMWNKESGWNNNAQNPHSSAYGIAQLLDGTWSGTGIKKTSDPGKQILAGENYIQNRYGDPDKAWSFWQKHNWYDKGAWNIQGDQDARLHKGEMVLPPQQAESVRSALQRDNNVTSSGRGHGGVVLEFAPGALQLTFTGAGIDPATQAAAAKGVMDLIANDSRLASIAGGVNV